MLNPYPKVIGEFETLDAILSGKSIARYGDGEFNLALGRDCISQKADGLLQRELCDILVEDNPNLLVAIPNMDPTGAKFDTYWHKYPARYTKHLNHAKTYYSSFITRPDSAQWCATKEYWDKVISIWKDRSVHLVIGTERSLEHSILEETGAAKVTVHSTLPTSAYIEIDQLTKTVRKSSSEEEVIIICAGAMATCMAARLSKCNRQALDLGHIGMFMKERYGYQR